MSAQHTPGPWHWDSPVWDYDPENDAPWLVDAADKRVLWGGIKCDREADAHLIAAAPDLLAAIKKRVKNVEQRAFEDWLTSACPSGCVEQVQSQWEGSYDYAEICEDWAEEFALIAKAEGAAS